MFKSTATTTTNNNNNSSNRINTSTASVAPAGTEMSLFPCDNSQILNCSSVSIYHREQEDAFHQLRLGLVRLDEQICQCASDGSYLKSVLESTLTFDCSNANGLKTIHDK